jgi:hypothetical protein
MQHVYAPPAVPQVPKPNICIQNHRSSNVFASFKKLKQIEKKSVVFARLGRSVAGTLTGARSFIARADIEVEGRKSSWAV